MKSVIVVPCFNESARLDVGEFVALVERSRDLALLFVDDGSTDETPRILETMSGHERITVLTLSRNVGKAEAVRQGLMRACATECDWVGYVDADLATPPTEVERLVGIAIGADDYDCVFGSRVRLCGNEVKRSLFRHATGRTFAGLADRVLGAHVYDTQAGAKFFRNTPRFASCLAEKFVDRWSFDVELFGRLGRVGIFPDRSLEVPLRTWIDREGSKVNLFAGLRSIASLARVRYRLRRAQ